MDTRPDQRANRMSLQDWENIKLFYDVLVHWADGGVFVRERLLLPQMETDDRAAAVVRLVDDARLYVSQNEHKRSKEHPIGNVVVADLVAFRTDAPEPGSQAHRFWVGKVANISSVTETHTLRWFHATVEFGLYHPWNGANSVQKVSLSRILTVVRGTRMSSGSQLRIDHTSKRRIEVALADKDHATFVPLTTNEEEEHLLQLMDREHHNLRESKQTVAAEETGPARKKRGRPKKT